MEISQEELDHFGYSCLQISEKQWAVVLEDDREPEWWRIIARFSEKARADSYAEIENMMLKDAEGISTWAPDLSISHAAVPAPASAIVAEQFTRRETFTQTRIEREETVTHAALEDVSEEGSSDSSTEYATERDILSRRARSGCASNTAFLRLLDRMQSGSILLSSLDKGQKEGRTLGHIVKEGYAQYIEGSRAAITKNGLAFIDAAGCAQSPEDDENLSKTEEVEEATDDLEKAEDVVLVDAKTLDPLTPKQAMAFRSLILALKESGDNAPSYSDMARHAGISGMSNYLYSLEGKGYIKNFGSYGAPKWQLLAFGEPHIEEPKDTRGRNIRHWTDEELTELRDLDPGKGDSYATFAEKTDRSIEAVMQQARTRRWYLPALLHLENVQKSPENDETVGADALEQQEPEHKETIADGPEIVDLDDLSKAPREILCIIAELHADKIHPIKEPDILNLSEVDEGRLPFALNRLRELNCIRRDGTGSWFPTSRGIDLADVIKAEENV